MRVIEWIATLVGRSTVPLEHLTPQCHYCRHHKGGACPAYPGGIPLAILTNQIDHRTEGYPLDRGLRFAPFSLESDRAQRALFDSAD